VLATTSDVCVRGTHPCKVRKDGAPSFVVIPAKTKGGPPAGWTKYDPATGVTSPVAAQAWQVIGDSGNNGAGIHF